MKHRKRIERIETALTPPPPEAEPYDYFKAIAAIAPTPESEAYWEAAARGEDVGPPPVARVPLKVRRHK